MRLPYLQVAMELIEQAAPDLAVILEWNERTAIGGLLTMIRWGLGRCPDDAPPSANAVVPGPAAARLIAKAAGYDGDPEAFVDACASIRPKPLLERVEGGIRIRGLNRYDEAWAAARVKSDKAKAAAKKRWGDAQGNADAMLKRCLDDAQPMLGACSDDARAMPQDAQTQTQTQTHTQIDKKAAAAAMEEFRKFFQEQRKAILGTDVVADRPLKPKQEIRLEEVVTAEAPDLLLHAVDAYLLDPHWRKQDPPCPLAGFIHKNQLPQYLSAADRVLWNQRQEQGAA